MNGLLALLILIACVIAGAEAKAPGVTGATVTTIAEVVANASLPAQLNAAMAAKGGAHP
ncbi:MAG TPA: hypothetical protein VMF32_25450 [Xanthobacteraceae bacterium]|nr:hypothetical protein [Xanthobacteraceae bacterium]